LTEQRSVSVIIPHFSDLRRLDRCLDALSGQTGLAAPPEIIVADNGSPEGEAAVLAVIQGRARLVRVMERGAGPARNGGVAVASGEVLAFTDSDCCPSPGWIAAGLAALGIGSVVGGQVDVFIAEPGRPTAVEAFERVFAFDNARYVQTKQFTVTANLFCARSDFQRVGGFRNGVSEDVEWCARALGAGLRLVYAPDAGVAHPARRTWTELVAKWRRINHETYGLHLVRPGGRILWALRALALPLSAVVHTPKVLLSPRLPRLGDRLGALRVLYRVRWWRMVDALRLFFQPADRP
jgi:GT2 family glycosyltransferase